MIKIYFFITILLIISLFTGCKNSSSTKELSKKKLYTNNLDENNAFVIADTIIYDVIIKNLDADDQWTDFCLSKLKKDALVDIVFNAVYSGKAKAFHYYDNTPITISQIKELEKEDDFSRDKIAKIQFTEEWLFDEINLKMSKRITSVMLGYEVYDHNGNVKGYKPTFRIYLNN